LGKLKSVRNRINKGFTGAGLKIPKSENRKNPCFWEEKLSFGERTLRFWEIHFFFFKMYFSSWGRKRSYFSGIKNASAILKRMRFSGTEQGILGSDVLFLGENQLFLGK